MNWEVTLGDFYARFYVSIVGIYNDPPMKVHTCAILIIFGYLKHHIKHWIIYETIFLEDQVEVYLYIKFSYLYPVAVENLTHNIPYTK